MGMRSEGIIEAIQHKEKNVFGVQWHPERCFRGENPAEIKKFNRLGYIFREDLSLETEYVFERRK